MSLTFKKLTQGQWKVPLVKIFYGFADQPFDKFQTPLGPLKPQGKKLILTLNLAQLVQDTLDLGHSAQLHQLGKSLALYLCSISNIYASGFSQFS